MSTIKTQIYKDYSGRHIVCKARVLFLDKQFCYGCDTFIRSEDIDTNYNHKKCTGMKTLGVCIDESRTPILVSDTETIRPGDKYVSLKHPHEIRVCDIIQRPTLTHHKKILVQNDNIRLESLSNVRDGEVFVECMEDSKSEIKLIGGYAKLFPIK